MLLLHARVRSAVGVSEGLVEREEEREAYSLGAGNEDTKALCEGVKVKKSVVAALNVGTLVIEGAEKMLCLVEALDVVAMLGIADALGDEIKSENTGDKLWLMAGEKEGALSEANSEVLCDGVDESEEVAHAEALLQSVSENESVRCAGHKQLW